MKKKRFALATRSTHKAAEIRATLAPHRIELLSLSDLGITESPEEDAIENRETFPDNAIAKGVYFARLTQLPTLADDSGLEVRALDGAPGVRTRRFAIDHGYVGEGGTALDAANIRLLLEKLASVAEGERGARYVCAAALVTPHGLVETAIGTCSGSIAYEPRGSGGFGYDPIFLLPDLGVTFAELSAEQKNRRSHRARAFRALSSLL